MKNTRRADDLEMDFVAAIEQQIHRTGGLGGDEFAPNNNNNNSSTIDNNLANSDGSFSPKEMRKFDSKKRWKNWGWKYSPSKGSSIEEEPPSVEAASTPSAKTSRHSSPTSSPKHKKADKESATATVVSQLLNQSPLRRRPQSGQASAAVAGTGQRFTNGKQQAAQAAAAAANAHHSASAANRSEIRSSAGARLCQQFENPDDDPLNDEFQTLIINGRPASVHIVPMSSTQLQ